MMMLLFFCCCYSSYNYQFFPFFFFKFPTTKQLLTTYYIRLLLFNIFFCFFVQLLKLSLLFYLIVCTTWIQPDRKQPVNQTEQPTNTEKTHKHQMQIVGCPTNKTLTDLIFSHIHNNTKFYTVCFVTLKKLVIFQLFQNF